MWKLLSDKQKTGTFAFAILPDKVTSPKRTYDVMV